MEVQVQTAKFNKYDPSKYADKSKGFTQGLHDFGDKVLKDIGISSSEKNKEDIENVGQGMPSNMHTPESTYALGNMDKMKSSDQIVKENKKASSVTRFNDSIRKLGDWVKSDGKEAAKNAGAKALKLGEDAIVNQMGQPSQSVNLQPAFQGSQISSSEKNKEDAPEVDKETVESNGGIIPMMAQIDSYLYKYKPEAQEEYAGTGMMNNDTNLGVIAEQMNENPLTKPAVTTDEKGNLALDGGRLSSINTAVISELCRKVMELESIVYGRR
jgi:hypothetical protein